MKKIYILLFLIIINTNLTEGLKIKRADTLTQIGSSAEMIGIGNIEGFTQGSSVLLDNPAGLTRLSRYSFSLFSTNIINEINYLAFSASTHTEYGQVGFGYMRAGSSGFLQTQRQDTNNDNGTNPAGKENDIFIDVRSFNYIESELFLSFAKQLDRRSSWGASLVFFNRNYGIAQGKGINFNLGLRKRLLGFDTSVTAKNIVPFLGLNYKLSDNYINNEGEIIYDKNSYSERETLPLEVVASIKKTIMENDIFVQTKLAKRQISYSFGTLYKPYYLPYASFSLGYKEFFAGTNLQRGLVFGFGFEHRDIRANFAFEKSDYIESNNKSYFSINVNLN